MLGRDVGEDEPAVRAGDPHADREQIDYGMQQIEPPLGVVRSRRRHRSCMSFEPRHVPCSRTPASRPIAAGRSQPSIAGTIVRPRQETLKAIAEGRAGRRKPNARFQHAQPFVNAGAQRREAGCVARRLRHNGGLPSDSLHSSMPVFPNLMLHQKRPGKGGQTMGRGRTI